MCLAAAVGPAFTPEQSFPSSIFERVIVRPSSRRRSLHVPARLANRPIGLEPLEPRRLLTAAAEVAKLVASDAATGDYLGYSVSISGDTAVIGSPYATDDAGDYAGKAYVFRRINGVWVEEAKLTASDSRSTDFFGQSVSISGDTAVVGATSATHLNDGYTRSGAAYIFTRKDGVWTQEEKLTASDSSAWDNFGWSVSIFGDTAVVGVNTHDPRSTISGAVYVFTQSEGVWKEDAKLTASDTVKSDLFGTRVSVYMDTILVGAIGDADNGTDSGSAYVFTRAGGIWTEEAKLMASDPAAGDSFGQSVSIFSDTAVIGADRDDGNGGVDSGSAYVFTRSGKAWAEEAKLTASEEEAYDSFGWSVAVSGDTVLIGAYLDDGVQTDSGAAYVFTRSDGVWTEQEELTDSHDPYYPAFGWSVAISGKNAIVGAPYEDAAGESSGTAYVFDLSPPPTAHITPVSPDPRDSAVDAVEIVFSEPVTGFDLGDLNLDRAYDGQGNLLSNPAYGPAPTLTTADDQTFTLSGLATRTAVGGSYVLSLKAAGSDVKSAAYGSSLATNAADRWANTAEVDAEPPTVKITPVSPDPTGAAIDAIEIVFSEPVLGFDLGDLNLDENYDGLGNRITGAETLTTADHQTFLLSGLGPITEHNASYVLSLKAAASGVTDPAGNPLANNGFEQWTKIDNTPPTVDIVDVTPDPRMNLPVTSIVIVFSEPVTGFDLGDLVLDRELDGLGNLLTGDQTLSTVDGQTYTLSGLQRITGGIGDYTLTLAASGSGIQDAAGNALVVGASDAWRNNIIFGQGEEEEESIL